MFHRWLQFWHVEFRLKSDGPWLLLLDICESHGNLPVLDDVTYCFLPAKITVLYQPIDQGLISFCKKKYRSCYLQRAFDTFLAFQNGLYYVDSGEAGRLGILDGRLPHVADAMSMLDMAWGTVARSTVIRSWIKSTCVADTHREELGLVHFWVTRLALRYKT